MSAIAGICYWGGRAVADTRLTAMAPFLERGGPHNVGTTMPAPGVVMQTYLLHFDNLSKQERQPHVFGESCVLSWDGRLDNRDDLLVELHHILGPDITDAALVAAAYTRWGLDAPRRLIGDWSLALWDGVQRRLLLAVDYMANRPLYYRELPAGLTWSSSLEALAEAFDLYQHPSLEYVAGTLLGYLPSHVTRYTGISRLRAGHLLVATEAAGVSVQRYWTLEPTMIRYKHLRDYADHTRALLIEAVRVRLRGNQRIWAHLSGGWDSSAIVCVAHALIDRRQVEAPALQPTSMVFPDSPESDESRYIEAVERHIGVASVRHRHTVRRQTFDEMVEGWRSDQHHAQDTRTPMQTAGDRILLAGDLGDVVMLRSAAQAISLLEPLHDGHPGRFLKLCFTRARHRQRPLLHTLATLAWLGYRPLSLQAAMQERTKRRARAREAGVPGRDLAAIYGMTPALYAHAPRRVTSPGAAAFPVVKRPYVDTIYFAADAGVTACNDLPAGVWFTFPFAHRPLVEFIAGVPQLAFWDPIFPRAGMARALEDILPREILTRESKGDPRSAAERAARSTVDHLLEGGMPTDVPSGWRVVKDGYVRREALERSTAALANGATAPSSFLMRCIGLEAWLRSLDGRRPQPPAVREGAARSAVSGARQELGPPALSGATF